MEMVEQKLGMNDSDFSGTSKLYYKKGRTKMVSKNGSSVACKKILECLEAVACGLAQREIVQQTTCFIFKEGKVLTFNEEQFCSKAFPVKVPDGAVQAAPLLALLRRLGDAKIGISHKDECLQVDTGTTVSRKQLRVRLDQEISLPVDMVESPDDGDWSKLPVDFMKALDIVRHCASDDASRFISTCIHVHPKWMEASDDRQLIRYKLKTGLKVPMLIHSESAIALSGKDMKEVAETEGWVHFRNKDGLIVSCRRYVDKYVDLTSSLGVEGDVFKLPKEIGDSVQLARIFSTEGLREDLILVKLKSGAFELSAEGDGGIYRERGKASYKGASIAFHIAPLLLLEIAKRGGSCVVGDQKLGVKKDKWEYVTCTSVVSNEGS